MGETLSHGSNKGGMWKYFTTPLYLRICPQMILTENIACIHLKQVYDIIYTIRNEHRYNLLTSSIL